MQPDALPIVSLKPRRALPFFSRHPWVFSGAVARVQGDPGPGDLVRLHSEQDEFIAYGLFNPDSNIKVRLYSWSEDTLVDESLWTDRIDTAVKLRERLFPSAGERSAFRVINSEADGLSGLTVDRYGRFLLVQLTSRAIALQQESIVEILQQRLQPAGIWLRTEKGIGDAEGLELQDGLVRGEAPPRPLFIEEGDLTFGVDVVQGQKTGHFLDQRENRRAAAGYMRGHRVLDMFCYTGGFSLAALRLGAAHSVHAVDASEHALTTARANAALNEVESQITFEQSDAYKALERLLEEKQQFDTVVLDPPKMARHRKGLNKALRGYFSLNRLAVDLLPPGGTLVTCSCSGLVSTQEFELMLASVAVQSGRAIQILERRGASADHPVSVTCPENSYLKCLICRVV